MRFRARKTLRVGPLFLRFAMNHSAPRFTSWGLKFGPWTWNATRGTHTFDTPGPGSVQLGGKRGSSRGERQ